VNIEEFEKHLLFFIRNSEEKIVYANVAYYLGIPLDEAKKHLENLAEKGILMLDCDDDGNLYYYMPNVKRKSDEKALQRYFFNFSDSKEVLGLKESAVMKEVRKCPYCMEPIRANAKKCKHCGEILDVTLINKGKVAKKDFPHLIHLLLTIITGGSWFIIWLLHYIFRDKDKYKS